MSFLTRTLPRTAATASFAARRTLATTPYLSKSATETVKETAQTIDRKAADAAIKGIEVGETATEKTKSAVGYGSEKPSEVAGQASGKASDVAGQASGKASELTGEAKGKASEMAGEAKGKKEEIKGKM